MEYFDNVEVCEERSADGLDKVTRKEYRTHCRYPPMRNCVYVHHESTLVQKKFLVTDYICQYEAFSHFYQGKEWKFNRDKYDAAYRSVGEPGSGCGR